jgi:23S rRNA pseudoU1915 N3-methylase RlmH
MKSITQYLEETLEVPFEKSQREYENELARQMNDEERLAFLKERARKQKRNVRLVLGGAAGLTTGIALYGKYRKKKQ